MSCRSNIVMKQKDGIYKSIYCHNDGNLEHNGVLLYYHYSDPIKVELLTSLGDISLLEENVFSDTTKEHTFDNRQDFVTVAYHRDRGEQLRFEVYNSKEKLLDDFSKSDSNYLYLFEDDKWFFVDKEKGLKFDPLEDNLLKENLIDNPSVPYSYEDELAGLYEENCYFLIKNNNLIIVDPGDEFEKINKKIKDNNLNLVAVLITHAHFDHIGALDKLLKKYNIALYYNNINNEIKYNELINIKEEKYKIDNFKFEVIYTPGHRNDSVTYYFYDDNIMFTGDFIFKETIGRTDLEYASIIDMKKSIEKIKKYCDHIIIYPGHGDKTTLKYEKENNYYLL